MPTSLRRAWPFAVWLGAAVLASLVGLGAVHLIGGDVGPSTTPVGQSAVPVVPVVASSGPPARTRTTSTEGGTVYASCAAPGARPTVQAVPAAGWKADRSHGGTVAELRQVTGTREVLVSVRCGATGPVSTVSIPQATTTGHPTTVVPTTVVPTTAPTRVDASEGGTHGGEPTAFPTAHGSGEMTAPPTTGDDHGGYPTTYPSYPGYPGGKPTSGYSGYPSSGGFGGGF